MNFSERKRKFSPVDGVFYPVRAIDPSDEIPAGLSLTLNAHRSRRFFFLLFLPSLLSLFSFCCLSSFFFPSLLFSLMGVVVERKIGNLEEDNVFVREGRGTELSTLFLRVKLNEA